MPDRSEEERRKRREASVRDLADVLNDLNHNPESFAKAIRRSPSGLRRIVSSDVTPSPSVASDILRGLYAEGYLGQPGDIKQLRGRLRGNMWKRDYWMNRVARGRLGGGYPPKEYPSKSKPETTDYRMKRIFDLAARSLGREESYRRLERLFGDEKPKGGGSDEVREEN